MSSARRFNCRRTHLKQKLAIDTIVPLRTNMDLYADAIGLTRLRGFAWEPYVPPDPGGTPPSPPATASAKPLRVQKREAKRQRTLAERKAQAAASASPPAAPATPTLAPRQTMLGLGRGLLSWSQCPVPLTAVVNRERDEHGQTQDWVLVTTSERFTAAQIRSTYELRPAIEERHRQYKCFWDLTRMNSCAFSLVVNQALLVLLAYTLVQVHLVLRQRQELNRGVWEYTRQMLSPSLERWERWPSSAASCWTSSIRPAPSCAKNSNGSNASSIRSWKMRGLPNPHLAPQSFRPSHSPPMLRRNGILFLPMTHYVNSLVRPSP